MLFTGLYNRTMELAAHPHAERYLAGVSIIEAIFFPVPTALMMVPMVIAKPHKVLRFASLATVTSVLGGIIGYLLGYLAISSIEPWIHAMGWWDNYMTAHNWFMEYGFWAVVIAGFTPIPFKVFTLSAGALHMAILPFILAALVGRAGHFFVIGLAMAWAGPKMEPVVRRYIEYLGWAIIVLAVIAYVIHQG